MARSAWARAARHGFTLVELLTVLVILATLFSLMTGAIWRARLKGKDAAIKTELTHLEMALEQYKNEYGEYPPDFFGVNNPDDDIRQYARGAVLRHLRRAFPQYRIQGATIDERFEYFAKDVQQNCGLNPRTFDPAAAAIFWLGGLPESIPNLPTGADPPLLIKPWQPVGFHEDPRHPFRTGLPRTQRLYDFPVDRLDVVPLHGDDDTIANQLRYYPEGVVGGDNAPYVYFRAYRGIAGRYEYGQVLDAQDPVGEPDRYVPPYYDHLGAGTNIAIPYTETQPTDPDNPLAHTIDERLAPVLKPADEYLRRWRNPEKFQILCAGLDGQYGDDDAVDSNGDPAVFRYTRSGFGFSKNDGDLDNLTNFAKGRLRVELEP